MTNEGDFLIRMEDLKHIGLKEPQGAVKKINTEDYISIRSMQGVKFILNEETLSLEITASPDLLGKEVIDFTSLRPSNVYYPKDSSVFLNYRIDYDTDLDSAQTTEVTNQLGVRHGDLLFLSDSTYTKDNEADKFVRLMSNITYDRRDLMQRIVIGDFFASSGVLGSSLNLGGISYSKAYIINPYFIKNPQIGFSGAVSLPTDVYVYLDGIQIRHERFSPGEFELSNISAREGAGLLEVVLRDPFGNEQRITESYYLTNAILKMGLHDYSYNIGFLREDFGEESSNYDDLIFSAFHRYGVNDQLTVNFMGEAAWERYNIGPSVSYRIQNLGVVALSLATSRDEDGQTGLAGSLNYGYQERRFTANLLVRDFSQDFRAIADESTSERTKLEASAGIGYVTKELGSLTFSYTAQIKDEGVDRKIMTVGYSRKLLDRVTFLATFTQTREEEETNEFIIGFHYYPGKNTSFSTRYQTSEDTSSGIVQVQKNPPLGEGFGGSGSFEHSTSEDTSTNKIDTFLQYNGRYGIYTGEYLKNSDDQTSRVSAAGGIAYVRDSIGFSRPITDSFGLVKVDDLKGVRVYNNSQEIGRTDSSGKVFVPNLNSYYDNQISISDRDIPIDYAISEVLKYVSPPLRSGSYIEFSAARFQAITGKISIEVDREAKPVEFYEVKMMVADQEITFPTGKEGEFYLENIKPGSYRTSFIYMEKSCFFDIIIPESIEMIIDLGDLTCERIQ